MKYEASADDYAQFVRNRKNNSHQEPTAAFFSAVATPSRKGRIGLRVGFLPGLSRFPEGRLFQVGDDRSKTVRSLTTIMSHGAPNPDDWFFVMLVEPVSCSCDDLQNVFLVSYEPAPPKADQSAAQLPTDIP